MSNDRNDRNNRPPRPPNPQQGQGPRRDRPRGPQPQRPPPQGGGQQQRPQGPQPHQNARPGESPRGQPSRRPPPAQPAPRNSQRPQQQRQGPQPPSLPRPPNVPTNVSGAQQSQRRPQRDEPRRDDARRDGENRNRGRRSLPPEAPVAQAGANRPAPPRRTPPPPQLVAEPRFAQETTPAAADDIETRTELPYGRRVYLPLASEAAPEDDLGEPDFPEYDWPEGAWLASVALVRMGEAARPVSCDAGNLPLRKGDAVVVESERGIDLAVVSAPPRRQMVEGRIGHRISRKANEADLRAETRTRLKEADAVRVANDIVHELKLPTKVVRAEVSLSGGRTVVFLASEERLEMRDLGRRLTDAFRGRVEIRHVGVRDAAKNIGGVGPCGLQLCCNTFLSDFAPVSIRQAKDQGLALNPQRVSGVCGRLMCCLVYEDAFYRQQRALFPKQGKRVQTPKGEGRVRDIDVLARTVRVLFPEGGIETFTVDDVRPVAAPAGQGVPASAGAPREPEEADEAPPEQSPVAGR